MIFLFVTFCLLDGALARVMNLPDSELRPMADFNMTAFLGKWYVVESPSTAALDCTNVEWKASRAGNIHAIVETRVIATNESYRYPSYRVQRELDDSGSPHLNITFPPFDYNIHALIFAVDYNSFAIVSVRDLSIRTSYLLILTRDRHPTEVTYSQIDYYIATMEVNVSPPLHKTNQSGCNPNPPLIIPESMIMQ